MKLEEKLTEYCLERLCEKVPDTTIDRSYMYYFQDLGNYPNIDYVIIGLDSNPGFMFDTEYLTVKVRLRSEHNKQFHDNSKFVIYNNKLIKKFKKYNTLIKNKNLIKRDLEKAKESEELKQAIKNTIEGLV